ncbi:MAG: 4-(cytidine 5'-diphospho)-2-C-methyl-D-erythritol kinase [Sphingomonadales bacterium]|nr:4-(cytidine 5'-diphospho)-2-C-methyl-D-erythritol kinase [Sphingomonadales bacterium]
MTDSEPAPAKLNLALHVRGRRDDGYHDIETLFAFADRGDTLFVEAGDVLSLDITGRFGADLDDEDDNLVLRAAHALRDHVGITDGARLTLDKCLPIASGIGGGSADAAATLRLLDRFWRLGLGIAELMPLARDLGADVPACLYGRCAIGSGAGDRLDPVANDLAGAPLLLVNPGSALSTAAIFAAWDGVDRGPLPAGPPSAVLATGRNDLAAAAIALAPAIAEVLEMLGERASIARMSGSGATCFALFSDVGERDAAAARIAAARPDWWTMPCRLA